MYESIASPLSRRALLKGAVSTAALGALAPSMLSGCSDAAAGPAYRAWHQKQKGTLTDLEYITQCGTLAASPHNTQPWKFRLLGNHIQVFADRERHLGHADQERRMMLMAVGAAIENMRVAAERLEYHTRVELDADARFRDGGYCATLHLERRAAGNTHPWFDALFNRQTTRTEFAALSAPPVRLLETLQAGQDLPGLTLQWFRTPHELQALADVNRASVRSFLAQDRNHRDGMRWFRISRAQWERHGDGIAVFNGDASWIAKEYVQWLVSTEDVLGDSFKQAEIEIVDRLVAATPMWGLIHAQRASNNLRVQAGRLAERVYLEAAVHGCALQPMCYATETDAGRRQLRLHAGLPAAAEPLFLFRLGRSQHVAKSVRRPLAEVLLA